MTTRILETTSTAASRTSRKPVPRGIMLDGPAFLSYGFRPFFLGAGGFAALAMLVWIGALSFGWPIGGDYGPIYWHGHEMLFGYAGAVLTGFLMTAIPNWTGRLPVAGMPLLALFALWLAGRAAMLVPGAIGNIPTAIVDASFLPVIGAFAAREILAGRNWKNLKVLAGVAMLSLANLGFHVSALSGGDPMVTLRLGVATYVALISLVGGRIVPSFTRNWLTKMGSGRLPSPAGPVDTLAFATLLPALVLWTVLPEGWPTAALAALAAMLQAVRLARWRGSATWREPLLAVLHVAYGFLPLGLACIAASAMGWLSSPSALHVLTVGGIGNMTLAMMTRASRGHTGHPVTASVLTIIAYFSLLVAAVGRPLAELLPPFYHLILDCSGAAWIVAFLCFVIEYGPMLVTKRLRAKGSS